MFLLEPANHNLHVGISLNQQCVCNVLTGMVNAIAETSHVMDDDFHQTVVWPLASIEEDYLLLQKIQQARKMDVIIVPYCKWGGHGALLRNGLCSGSLRRHIELQRLI